MNIDKLAEIVVHLKCEFYEIHRTFRWAIWALALGAVYFPIIQIILLVHRNLNAAGGWASVIGLIALVSLWWSIKDRVVKNPVSLVPIDDMEDDARRCLHMESHNPTRTIKVTRASLVTRHGLKWSESLPLPVKRDSFPVTLSPLQDHKVYLSDKEEDVKEWLEEVERLFDQGGSRYMRITLKEEGKERHLYSPVINWNIIRGFY